MDRTELLEIFERDNSVQLSEKERERFFQETEPEKISALCVEYFYEWGDSLQCDIVYNFETEKIERRVGTEPYPDDCIEVYSLYPRWTRDLEFADLFDEDEIEKFRWYVAGRRFEPHLKEFAKEEYKDDSLRMPEVKDFLDILLEVSEEEVKTLKERLESLIEDWLFGF
ncbi:MAG TPA: hypothetical protein PK564_03195 [bacterium]|nr:hypothetical protein [bacterium]